MGFDPSLDIGDEEGKLRMMPRISEGPSGAIYSFKGHERRITSKGKGYGKEMC